MVVDRSRCTSLGAALGRTALGLTRYRDQQPSNALFSHGSLDPAIDGPSRSMLDADQRAWLLHGLSQTPAAWRLLGNPVPFFPLVPAPGSLATLSED
ncbi:MAG: alkaline phosphatase D family protein [Acidimicrobiales bacterium]|nr:alkaline phosphatase D family protein [Acidimicrobiales bacterium]